MEEIQKSKLSKYEQISFCNMDRWPADVWELTFGPNIIIPIPLEHFINAVDGNNSNVLLKFAADLQKAMGSREWFVKLTSRSPKDVIDLPVTNCANQALDWLLSSMRCVDDLYDLYNIQKPAFLVLRNPVKIEKKYEFRCFVKSGELKGVSQYFYNLDFDYHINEIKIIEERIRTFFEKLKNIFPYSDFVFDVYFEKYGEYIGSPILIEINPYGLSDPCMFKSYDFLEKGYKVLTAESKN